MVPRRIFYGTSNIFLLYLDAFWGVPRCISWGTAVHFLGHRDAILGVRPCGVWGRVWPKCGLLLGFGSVGGWSGPRPLGCAGSWSEIGVAGCRFQCQQNKMAAKQKEMAPPTLLFCVRSKKEMHFPLDSFQENLVFGDNFVLARRSVACVVACVVRNDIGRWPAALVVVGVRVLAVAVLGPQARGVAFACLRQRRFPIQAHLDFLLHSHV